MRCKYCTGENSDSDDNAISKSNTKYSCPIMEQEEPILEVPEIEQVCI